MSVDQLWLLFNAYGWYTGHKVETDYIKLEKLNKEKNVWNYKLPLDLYGYLSRIYVVTTNIQIDHGKQKGMKRMSKTTTIQARINPKIKTQAQKILNTLHISMSEAISIYLTQIALHKGIPFEIKVPNELTAKTIINADNGKGLHKAKSVDQLFRDLDS